MSGATFSTNQRPFVTCSKEGSRVWRPLHVFLSNSDWFVGLSAFSVIGLVFRGAVLVMGTSTKSYCERCDVTISMEAMVAWLFHSFRFIIFSSFYVCRLKLRKTYSFIFDQSLERFFFFA